MSRQNYYKSRRLRQRRQVDESLIISLVQQERRLQPYLGGRKLLSILRGELQLCDIAMGRDNLFKLLSEHGLLIKRKRRAVQTTDSNHSFRQYSNLLRDFPLTGPHQAWVSDITYIRTDAGFVYLSLIMDAYSRQVVGYDSSDSLESEGCLCSLSQALRQLPEGYHPIHHSDRGIQYCCHAYTGQLRSAGLSISMTEENHCYENAKAERLNGILKQEYGLGGTFSSKAMAYQAIQQAVYLYNTRRPHTALGYRCPSEVHREVA